MNYFTAALLFATLSTSVAHAKESPNRFSLQLVNSNDDFTFNIASDLSGSQTPNILSELTWSDMDVWMLEGAVRYGIGKHFKIFGEVGLGMIDGGEALDSDYFGDNRTEEFSRATATVDGDQHVRGMFAIGWEFDWRFEKPLWRLGETDKRFALSSDIRITPKIGFSHRKQEIDFTDGIQHIPDLGAFPGLNSGFDHEWSGYFLGVDAEIRLFREIHLSASINYMLDEEYNGVGHWNLRADLNQPESFIHSADSDGIDSSLGIIWRYSKRGELAFNYRYSNRTSDVGVDKVITSQHFILFTRLNEAEWESEGYSLTWSRFF